MAYFPCLANCCFVVEIHAIESYVAVFVNLNKEALRKFIAVVHNRAGFHICISAVFNCHVTDGTASERCKVCLHYAFRIVEREMKVTAERHYLRIIGKDIRKVCCVPHEVIARVKLASVNRMIYHRMSENEYRLFGIVFLEHFKSVSEPFLCCGLIRSRNAVYLAVAYSAVGLKEYEIIIAYLAKTAAV